MAQIISFVNFKGGVAKTTSALSIGGELAERGYKTLLIDLDPQGNLSSALGKKGETKSEDMTSKLLLQEATGNECVKGTDIPNLEIIPTCSFNLVRAMKEIDADTMRRSDIRLKKALISLQKNYDFLLVDCSPSDNVLNTNALVASDYVVIPVKLDKYSLEGFDILQEKISIIQEESNDSLKILGVLPTMYRPTSLYNLLLDTIKESSLKNYLFDTVIRVNVKLEESPFEEKPLNFYDKSSNGAKDYKQVTDEILCRIGGK